MTKKVLVFGAGYVGSSLSVLLAQKHEVVLIDIDDTKISKINNKDAPIDEPLLKEYLNKKEINIHACMSYEDHIDSTDFIILALPTNYDETKDAFDTRVLESVLKKLDNMSFRKSIIIKSTVFIGFTEKANSDFPNLNIIFVPEFLREGNAIMDNLNPSRIVIGTNQESDLDIAEVFLSIAENSPKVIHMRSTEAEAVKLFSNTYLATRVSFFNELDSFALENNLNSNQIIDGVTTDPRIGEFYHNPSFGYGGYCLPKDSKQLLANYKNIPQSIFSAVVESNYLRKEFLARKILSSNPSTIGIYRLIMKTGSKNFRESAVFDIMEILRKAGKTIIVFEPYCSDGIDSFETINDIDEFKNLSDIILANRVDEFITDVKEKVFSRDIYSEN
jgi:UDPglucose 6-dehydrogenase